MTLVLFEYGRNRSTAHTVEKHNLCVVSNRRLGSECDVEWYRKVSLLYRIINLRERDERIRRRRLYYVKGQRLDLEAQREALI